MVKPKQIVKTFKPTVEDRKILKDLNRKLGVDFSQILRLAIRKLAEHEGIRAA